MHICMYSPTAIGGQARYSHELLSAIAMHGRHRDVAVSLACTQGLADDYRSERYPIHDVLPPLRHRSSFATPLHWALSRAYSRREQSFLKLVAHNPHISGIHFQEYTPWLAVKHFQEIRRMGKLLFYTVHNIYPHYYPPLVPRKLVDAWNRSAWRLCDGLFVHTEKLRDELSAFLGPAHPPIFVSPHGLWRTGDRSGEAGALSAKLGCKRLLSFGVIRQYKGLHILLQAMKHLPDLQLTVAGSPDDHAYWQSLQPLLAELPPGQVELHTRFIEEHEIPHLFNRSALAVLPYTAFPAQSGVLHMALSYGLPVVVTDLGGMGESVRAWGVGRVVEANDPVQLARAIRESLETDAYTRATEAIDRVEDALSWDETAKRTIEAYAYIAGKQTGATRVTGVGQ